VLQVGLQVCTFFFIFSLQNLKKNENSQHILKNKMTSHHNSVVYSFPLQLALFLEFFLLVYCCCCRIEGWMNIDG
jgi:hypothetical protein